MQLRLADLSFLFKKSLKEYLKNFLHLFTKVVKNIPRAKIKFMPDVDYELNKTRNLHAQC